MKTPMMYGYYHRLQAIVDRQAILAHKHNQGSDKTLPIDWNFRRFIDNCNQLFR